jgi:hypothetical protein
MITDQTRAVNGRDSKSLKQPGKPQQRELQREFPRASLLDRSVPLGLRDPDLPG